VVYGPLGPNKKVCFAIFVSVDICSFVYVADLNEEEGIMNFQAIDSKAEVFDTFSRPTKMP
jgi:hypothetical protein